jgi:small subunit ribosomal protein S17
MAEEDKTEETETEAAETAEEPAAEAPEATPAAEAPEAAPAGEAPAAPAAEVVPPKERRQRARAAKAAQTKSREQRSGEERHAERVAQRSRKASLRRVERERARAKARAEHATGQTTPPREREPGVQKTRQGVVVSDRADKTITVRIDVTRRHRRYEKIVRTSNTLHAHDETNDAHVGDTVVVRESRPLSRTKRWRLVEVVERAK